MQLFVKIENNSPVLPALIGTNLRQIVTGLPASHLFPADVEPHGYALFVHTAKPANDNPTKEVVEVAPTEKNSDGAWLQKWALRDRDLSDEERQSLLDEYIITLRSKMKTELAAIRYQCEIAGITLDNGMVVNTDREDQSMLASAYQALKSGLIDSTEWKAPTGWVTVALADLEPVAQAVASHVSGCFTAERSVAQQIDDATDVDALQAINVRDEFEAAL